MRFKKTVNILCMATLLIGCSQQATAVKEEVVESKTIEIQAQPKQQQNFEKNMAAIVDGKLPKIEHIKATALNNVFEVLLENGEILYTDAAGEFAIQGEVIDLLKKEPLSLATLKVQQAKQQANARELIDKLDLSQALKTVKGDGERQLIVFADPNCGFCKKFEQDLQTVDNITIYTYLVPILGPKSEQDSQNILCAKNAEQAWLDWMIKGTLVPKVADCDAKAVAAKLLYNQHNFERLGFNGTPSLIFADNEIIKGYINKQQLEDKFQQIARAKK